MAGSWRSPRAGSTPRPCPWTTCSTSAATYDGPRAYARAKRAQVALIREWARRLRSSSVVANAMHPGWADTPGLEASLPGFRDLMGDRLRSAEEGVDTILWLAAAPEARARTGQLFLDRRPRPFDRVPMTRLSPADRRELWDRVVALTGEPDPTADDRGRRRVSASAGSGAPTPRSEQRFCSHHSFRASTVRTAASASADHARTRSRPRTIEAGIARRSDRR